MSWVAVAVGVGSAVVGAYGASEQSKAAKQGADANQAWQEKGINEQRRQYDQSRQDMLPWLNAGTGALGQMQALNSGDFSQFYESPDYKFAFSEGQRALDQGAASRGGLFGGGNSRDSIRYGQGMASQQYNSFYNKLQSMAGQGQTTAGGLGQLGAQMAGNIQQGYGNIGQARQSAYNTKGQAYGDYANSLAGMMNYYGQNYGSGR
jgi:hypothetical protein